MNKFFSSTVGIIVTGAVIGLIAASLQFFGNPGNMGFCIACFGRDTAGALGLHSVEKLSYIRPEIVGLVLGAMIAALTAGEYKVRSGSNTLIKFFLGAFAAVGALVFLGCPWRAALRLAGGDLNAIIGLLGLVSGIFVGSIFIKKGYTLGKRVESHSKAPGFILPALLVTILVLMVAQFKGITIGTAPRAPLFLSLILAIVVGFIAQKSRFCTVGAFRNIFMVKEFHLLKGLIALIVGAMILNIILGQFNLGFEGQPAAHTDHIWNYLGMVLSGMAFTLAGGCPGRQLILAGEGDGDGAIFFLGLLVGAGLAHNFSLTSSGKGVGEFGAIGTIIGIMFCVIIGFTMIQKRAAK